MSKKQTAAIMSVPSESKWKRSKPSRIYDYNYKVSEGYYQPQTDYIDTRFRARNEQPPADTHLSYAERFSNRPWYGGTRGLPYDDSKSELNKPLLKPSERPRGSSLIREMQEDEKDDIPLHIRALRRKKRMEEEEELLGIRAKPKTNMSSLRDEKPVSGKYDSRSSYRSEVPSFSDLRRIDNDFNRSIDRSRRSSSIDAVPSYSRDPVKRAYHEDSYTLPSGTRVKKVSDTASYQSSSKYSRPPVAPRSRNISFTEETSSTLGRPRSRLNSFSGSSLDFPSSAVNRSYRHSSITSDDEDLPVYNSRAAKIRDERKHRESEALTENIHKMVEKMRVRDIDPTAAYSFRQNLRASSLEPPLRSKNKAKTHNFVYGVGRV